METILGIWLAVLTIGTVLYNIGFFLLYKMGVEAWANDIESAHKALCGLETGYLDHGRRIEKLEERTDRMGDGLNQISVNMQQLTGRRP
jgi:hypothetical protein